MNPQPISGRSDVLLPSPLPAHEPVRWAYLSRYASAAPPPVLSISPFVPRPLAVHLMRDKKNRAFKRKFHALSGTEAITDMEGALHSYVTPVVGVWMHGDYVWRGHHAVVDFPNVGGKQSARWVVLSALVQPDFEGRKVMYAASVLGAPVRGEEWDGAIPTVEEKQIDSVREAYDARLRRHMVYHLTSARCLPARAAVVPMSEAEAIDYIASGGDPTDQYVTPPADAAAALSLELLFNSALETLANELSALEALAPQGYVFTASPPAIFAKTLGATLLNRLFIAALGRIARLNPLENMKVFAFGDHADAGAVQLCRAALAPCAHVLVLSKSELFPPPEQTYRPPPEGEGALLVIHNNSDAFGQNVEYEGATSLDGVVGSYSSAAASLARERADLCDHWLPQERRLRVR